MLVPKLVLNAALKFIMPQVEELVKPLFQYKDEPNDADQRIDELEKINISLFNKVEELEKLSHSKTDWTQQISSLANELNTANKKLDDMTDNLLPKVIGTQAMVDKFDRDQDYLEERVRKITDILTKIIKGDK
jgi:predicted  nucleic acid-binding Zn-ribbon protein